MAQLKGHSFGILSSAEDRNPATEKNVRSTPGQDKAKAGMKPAFLFVVNFFFLP
jgi:hypothetical protein